jgi:hypothetical protein
VRSLAVEEVAAYRAVFGCPPAVVVPPTFVWTAEVERAWAGEGVVAIVTPGRRLEHRDREGRPGGPPGALWNGQRGSEEVVYLVRDVYFEPALGHRPEAALEVVEERVRCGRPALVEIHRANFVGDPKEAQAAGVALRSLLAGAERRFAALRYLSAEELAAQYRDPSTGDLVRTDLRARAGMFPRRLLAVPGLARWAARTGLGPVLRALSRAGSGAGKPPGEPASLQETTTR